VSFRANQQVLSITRRQVGDGESVELLSAGRVLTWSASEGAKVALSAPTADERLLVERLIYDSPDYFVLAQLRGASYFRVAQNVRPPEAPDNYTGPLWTVVRVDEPQIEESVRPRSSWRLYYINSNTGLIDRIVSRLGDETVEAEIISWTEHDGEKIPSQVTWSIAGRAVMNYQVTSVNQSRLAGEAL
jgi:hypothetical protein